MTIVEKEKGLLLKTTSDTITDVAIVEGLID